ncbi:MAG: Hpt domain-containing protein [Chitinophagaceae bacterium]
MNQPPKHNAFIFNHKFDNELLISLYEDDFPYIEEIFSITLKQLKPDIAILKEAYASGNLPMLQKTVHKIKPSFGFVGLPHTQELCLQFEGSCGKAGNTNELASQYTLLCTRLEDSVELIETELAKLKAFNL